MLLYSLSASSTWGSPCSSADKESACDKGAWVWSLWAGKIPREGKGYLQYSSWRYFRLYSPWGIRVGHDWAASFSLSLSCAWHYHNSANAKMNKIAVVILKGLLPVSSCWTAGYWSSSSQSSLRTLGKGRERSLRPTVCEAPICFCVHHNTDYSLFFGSTQGLYSCCLWTPEYWIPNYLLHLKAKD